MPRRLFVALGLAFASLSAGATINYPFPFQADYPYGIRTTGLSATTIQSRFQAWLDYYYIESSDGSKARIGWYDPSANGNSAAKGAGCNQDNGLCTVSEGIGYGMLIMVYMDNPSNNTKAKFDKLWAYYNANTNGKGLMHWLVKDFSGTVGGSGDGAATDGDLDAALALCMAYKQWGDAKYLSDAKTLLTKIRNNEIASDIVKPDDQGTSNLFNPSYFAVAALRVFASVDNSNADAWNRAASTCLSKLQAIQAKYTETGFVPDWVDGNNNAVDHNGSGTTKFGYDAVRTPWRVGLDYLWFGTAGSMTFQNKIASWVKKTFVNANAIRIEYSLDGKNYSSGGNSVYQGAFAIASTADPADTQWVRMGGLRILSMSPNGVFYYNDSWEILYLLTLSGNFQNLWGTVKQPSAVESPAARGAGWSVALRSGDVELRGAGRANASLLDASGKVLSRGAGDGSILLARPAVRGIYFVRVQGSEGGVLPVVVE